MTKKSFNIITTALAAILVVACFVTYDIYKNKYMKRVSAPVNASKPPITSDVKLIDKEQIIKKLSLENSMTCLSGEDEVKEKFSSQNISDEDTALSWLKAKLLGRELVVDAVFKYTFAYSLENIDKAISINDNKITINLKGNNLSLIQCELEEDKSEFSSNIGMLKNDFSPQELNVLNKRIKDSTQNTIQSDKDRRNKAIENVKSNIKGLLQNVVNEDTEIYFNVPSYDVVEQDDVEIVK